MKLHQNGDTVDHLVPRVEPDSQRRVIEDIGAQLQVLVGDLDDGGGIDRKGEVQVAARNVVLRVVQECSEERRSVEHETLIAQDFAGTIS